MEKEQFIELADKVFQGTASKDEIAKYSHYVQYLHEETTWSSDIHGDEASERDAIFEVITKTTTPISKNYGKTVTVAATLLIAFSVGLYFLFSNNNNQLLSNETFAITDIAPGSNRAMLTLADGSKITLDQLRIGDIAYQAGVKISKSDDGLLIYEHQIDNEIKTGASTVYNTITIPNGGYYTVVLPDGTKVWLNASTIFKFPTQFEKENRVVELTGEAYFEVAKHTNSNGKILPFIVSTYSQDVEVLGTHFNISSYEDEMLTTTTLLEGKVKVHVKQLVNSAIGKKKDRNVILKPNQQSVLVSGKNNIKVATVDSEEVIAWKDGLFIFNDEPLESIMRKISRWYNVDIVFEDADPKRIYWGSVSRFENVSEVLRKLELTGSVNFKLEKNGKERRIVVMK